MKRGYELLLLTAITIHLSGLLGGPTAVAQQSSTLNPAQTEIEKQRQRLGATDPEERRDAIMRLGAMHRADASRVAMVGLTDASPMIRAVAAKAITFVGSDESVVALRPLVTDKDEFVRKEAAYALGLTKSRRATELLTQLLLNDKDDGVRSAAAVGLGDVADDSAVVALANILTQDTSSKKKSKVEKNVFVLRAAARSLGQIKSRAGVPALLAVLTNEEMVEDVRREAAHALGVIGDPVAVPALKNVAASSGDPYLAQAASESLQKINP